MKLTPQTGLLALSLTLGGISPLFAGQAKVNVSSFRLASDFQFVNTNVDFRFAPLAGDGSGATHMIINGLIPGGAGAHVTDYKAVNLQGSNPNAALESGKAYIKLPAQNLPAGSVSSPIVGIVQRNGAWSNYTVTFASNTTVGGAAGNVSFNGSQLTFTLTRGGTSFTGTANYEVVGDTLEVEPFSLSDGGTTYNFDATTLQHDGTRFFAVLSSNPAANYDSLLFELALTEVPDVDGDSVPDIIDGEIASESLFADVVWGNTGWGFSNFFGWLNKTSEPWFYSLDHGWVIPVQGASDNSFIAYNTRGGLGYIYTTKDLYNAQSKQPTFIYSYARGSWMIYLYGSGGGNGRWFYDFKLSKWVSIAD